MPAPRQALASKEGRRREMRVSVVIPARDAAGVLADCLEAVRASRGPQPCEVIVAVDGSTDATAMLARAHGATVLELAGGGPAAARNAGAARATGDVLIFFDADCAPDSHCIEALMRPFDDPVVVGVRGGYISRQRALVARFTQLELDEKQERLATSPNVTVMDTACVAYRRAVFAEVGGFDERLPATSAEDVELSFRLAARGKRMIFAPEALVSHRHPERLGSYVRRKLRFGFYRAQLYRRYPRRMREDGYTPRMMPVQIALTGVVVAMTLLSAWLPAARPLAGGATLLFIGACLPLVERAWRSDRGLVPVVPWLLFARSLAQGLGLLGGLVVVACQQIRHRPIDAAPPLVAAPLEQG
jgi:GT2 family glycosyltransferase